MVSKYNPLNNGADMGIKFYLKVNGVFKEVNFTTVTDSNGIVHPRITITQ